MKTLPVLVNVALAVALLAGLLVFASPQLPAQAATPSATPSATPASDLACDTGRTIQVSGTAAVNVVPDRVVVQLGVQSNGVTVAEVEAANTRAIRKVIQALRDQGVAEKDIATDWYIIEPLYDSYDSLYIKGYRINNLVAVTLRQASRVTPVVAAALKAGANQVVNVEFYTNELRKYRDQARELAMQAAGEKAAALAQAAGAQRGCVRSITENTWSYFNSWWYGRGQNQWAQNVVQNALPAGSSGGTGDGPVSLGQISVQAEVSIVYALK
ncbi:MAG: DUF541 domain-containing protein [Chloroflexi bacterium]|nr:DUF541 domain-containing protein [Chloroflexota bacterium]